MCVWEHFLPSCLPFFKNFIFSSFFSSFYSFPLTPSVSFVSWHINLRRSFNVKAIPRKQLWYFLTHSWMEEGFFHTAPKGISLKVNVIVRLDFQLDHSDVAVQYVIDQTTSTHLFFFSFLFFCFLVCPSFLLLPKCLLFSFSCFLCLYIFFSFISGLSFFPSPFLFFLSFFLSLSIFIFLSSFSSSLPPFPFYFLIFYLPVFLQFFFLLFTFLFPFFFLSFAFYPIFCLL